MSFNKKFTYLFFGADPYKSQDEAVENIKQWTNWINDLAQKGIFVSGEQLEPDLRRLEGKKKKLNDGPFTESKEIISGIMVINAKDFDHAVEIAKDCPILDYNGNVEIRPNMQLQG